jgi:hypothetical protein
MIEKLHAGMEIPTLSPNDTSFVNVISTYALPLVSGINIWVNVINIMILSRSIFKGSVYKYLMFNSVFEVLTLALIGFKAIIKTVLTENIVEFYVYVYFTSFFLMSANLSGLAAMLERIVKLSGESRKPGAKKQSYKLFLFLLILFSGIVNSPVLYAHEYFELEWYKNVYYELSLTKYGSENFWAKFAISINAIINVAIFCLAIFFNLTIFRLVNKNSKKLKQLIELENAKSSGDFIINIGKKILLYYSFIKINK